MGPPPVQDPGPPILIGAGQPKAVERAVRAGDGFLFGTAGSAAMRHAPSSARPSPRRASPRRRSPGSRTWRSATTRRRRSTRRHTTSSRYYGQLWTEPANLIHHGPSSKLAEEIAAYADAGIDLLIVFPRSSLDQVAQLAEHVLPAYL